MQFPRMVKVKQKLSSSPLSSPATTLAEGLEKSGFPGSLKKGGRVAVAVGSRRIEGLVPLLSALTGSISEAGCEPFVIPAMGSHGGATEEGQAAVLASLGVTWETVGAPVFPSMETVALGRTPGGAEAFCARSALEADAAVVVNRVAPHTGYSGPIQSGVVKMVAVGLGKADGARALHAHGFDSGHLIGEVADLVAAKAPPLTAVAIVVDGTKAIARLEVLSAGEARAREPALLGLALDMWPGLPFAEADLLVVDEMGKDISGIGMDPLVTGRGKDAPVEGPGPFAAKRLVVLRLSGASSGNATGIGHADITTRRLADAIDWEATRLNVLTSGALHRARLPLVADSDREALDMAVQSLGGTSPEGMKAVRIKSTAELSELYVSEALAVELEGNPSVELAGGLEQMRFGAGGDIL